MTVKVLTGVVFRDRKLNKCAHCDTRKQLGVTFTSCGKLYFLCRSHYLILALMVRDARRVGVSL